MSEKKEYRNIFKSTFLFGFVQIFNIAVKVGLNKIVALLLGTEGMGAISLYNTTIHLVSVGAGLGVSQSAVRDISDARGSNKNQRLDITISFVKKIIRYTSLLGIVAMAALSPWLSEWTFGTRNYTLSYLLLSLATGATIQTNGYRAINTGMRELRNVAMSTIWGSVAGLVSAIPLYFILGERGIVPSLIISSITTLLIAKYYADKVKHKLIKMSLTEAIHQSSDMIKMGISLMLMSFMLTGTQLIVSSYISSHGGLSIVGIYQAGATIVTSYFGIIISAMSTEYYPRISSFHKDNEKLHDAVNSQSEIGLLLSMPLMVVFVFLAKYFILFLYSDKFLSATSYLDYAVLGTIAIICSNPMGMILLAKQNRKLFLMASLIGDVLTIIINILLFNYLGLKGLGIAYMINGIKQFIMYDYIMYSNYNIHFNWRIILSLIGLYGLCALASGIRSIEMDSIRWLCGIGLFCISGWISFSQLNERMGIDVLQLIIKRIKR